MVNVIQGHHLRFLDIHSCNWCVDSCWTSIARKDDNAMVESWRVIWNGLEKCVPQACIPVGQLCFVEYENRRHIIIPVFILFEMFLPSIRIRYNVRPAIDPDQGCGWFQHRKVPAKKLRKRWLATCGGSANLQRIRMTSMSFRYITHLNKTISLEFIIQCCYSLLAGRHSC